MKYDPEYQKQYYKEHKQRRHYIMYKSNAKHFIKIATKQDLFELFQLIDHKMEGLK